MGQFSVKTYNRPGSLLSATQQLGLKWDIRPTLNLTAAIYQLDRTNTRAADPNDPARTVLTGA